MAEDRCFVQRGRRSEGEPSVDKLVHHHRIELAGCAVAESVRRRASMRQGREVGGVGDHAPQQSVV